MVGIARYEENLCGGMQFIHLNRQLSSAHIWHHNIGDNKINALSLYRSKAQSGLAIGRRENAITQTHEVVAGHLANGHLVFYKKNRFGTCDLSRLLLLILIWSFPLVASWQEYSECRSLAGLALHRNCSVALFYNPVHH